MKGSDLVVVGGTLVTPESIFTADIRIEEGRIVQVGRGLSSAGSPTINAAGMFVLPGIIDSHVHMRDPGLTHKEDFGTGTAAAAAGGVTTVLEMPNTLPPVDSVETLQKKKQVLEPKAVVDFGLYAVLHDGNARDIPALIENGAVGLKAFLGPSTGNIPSPSDATIYESLLTAKRYGIPIAFHAENDSLVRFYSERVKGEGRMDAKAHCDSRPTICEAEAINRISFLAERSGGRAHVIHMSTADGVKIIADFKRRGVAITCETDPQYLSMTSEDQARLGCLAKINPPLRGHEDQMALWEGVVSDVIDTLGSDHAPHLVEEKRNPDIWAAPAGFIGVETLLPVMLDFVNKGRLPIQKLVVLLSQNPAKLFNLWPKKGGIREGADGDLTIVDMAQDYVIKAESLHSKQKITPFEGRRVRGAVKHTVVRGNVVFDGDVGPAAGTWIAPLQSR